MLAELALFMMFSFVSCFLHIQVAVERLKAYAPGSKKTVHFRAMVTMEH